MNYSRGIVALESTQHSSKHLTKLPKLVMPLHLVTEQMIVELLGSPFLKMNGFVSDYGKEEKPFWEL